MAFFQKNAWFCDLINMKDMQTEKEGRKQQTILQTNDKQWRDRA